MIIDPKATSERIYIVRGQKVMLDYDPAEIYGYTTKAFNQQVKNTLERFDDDFRFQLAEEEWHNLRSKNLTPSWGGKRYAPDAGNRVTMISEVADHAVYHSLIDEILHCPPLKLRR